MANAVPHGVFLGELRLNWPSGHNPLGIGGGTVFVRLVDAAAGDAIGIPTANAGDLECRIVPPLGNAFAYTKDLTIAPDVSPNDSVPTWTNLTNGYHALRLWGGFDAKSGWGSNPRKDLQYPGMYSVTIHRVSGTPAIQSFAGWYRVRPGLQVNGSFVWGPGSAGTGAIIGAVEVIQWADAEVPRLIDKLGGSLPLDTDLTALTLRVSDLADNAWLSQKDLLTDPAVDNQGGTLYFEFPVSGLPGAHIVRARVAGTYRSIPFQRDFLLAVPEAA